MTGEMSMMSIKELTQADSTRNGTLNIEEKIEKIKAVQSVIQTIQSRILFFQGKMLQGNASLGGNVTQGNVTVVTENSYMKELENLITVTSAINLRTAMMKMAVFNNLSQSIPDVADLMSDPRSGFPKVSRFLGVLDGQKTLCQELEKEQQARLDKEIACVGLIADIKDKIQNNAQSEIQEEQLKRMMKMNAHIKCARAMINCLLVKNLRSKYVTHPELLEIKIRSRTPQFIKF